MFTYLKDYLFISSLYFQICQFHNLSSFSFLSFLAFQQKSLFFYDNNLTRCNTQDSISPFLRTRQKKRFLIYMFFRYKEFKKTKYYSTEKLSVTIETENSGRTKLHAEVQLSRIRRNYSYPAHGKAVHFPL